MGGTWRSNDGTTQGSGCEGQSLRGQPHPAAHGALVLWEDSIGVPMEPPKASPFQGLKLDPHGDEG